MDNPALPSNRSFGWTFTGVFIVVGACGHEIAGILLARHLCGSRE